MRSVGVDKHEITLFLHKVLERRKHTLMRENKVATSLIAGKSDLLFSVKYMLMKGIQTFQRNAFLLSTGLFSFMWLF